MALTLDNTSIASGQTVNLTAWTITMPAGTEPVLSTAARNAAADAVAALIDQGAGAGKVKIYTTAFGTLLATFTMSDPAFGAAAAGVATAASLPKSTTGAANGTAAVYEVTDSDDTQLWTGTVS